MKPKLSVSESRAYLNGLKDGVTEAKVTLLLLEKKLRNDKKWGEDVRRGMNLIVSEFLNELRQRTR